MQARRLPAARGIIWVSAGFALYRRGPALLTMLTMFYLLLVMAASIIQPLGSILMPLFLPALTVLVANGCRLLDPAQATPAPGALWFGLKGRRAPLLRLGGLQLVATLGVLGLDLLVSGGDWSALSASEEGEQLLWHLARLLALATPTLMAFWFAPLLTAWDGVPATKSLFFSLVASLRNWRAFLAYAATVMVIGIAVPTVLLLVASLISAGLVTLLSAALRMALILIMAPVLLASVYLSYRDVFSAAPAASES